MAHLPIQCQNCGAKYKIPETFAGDFAKCKACGTKIGVQAARSETEPATASPRKSTKRETGATRKSRPRTGDAVGRRSQRGDSEESPKKRRAAGAGRRRGHRSDDGNADGEDGDDGGRHYQKKKDHTAVLLGGSVLALGIVAVVIFMVWSGSQDDKVDPKGSSKTAQNTAKPTDSDPSKSGATAGDAKKSDPAEATEAAVKKAPAKKPKKKKKKKPKKISEIEKPEDVFKPSTLDPLARPEGLSDEEADAINQLLDDLKEGGGLTFIRAPKYLEAKGTKMLPLAVNRLMTLDYTLPSDNQYAFWISEAIKRLTGFELAFDPARNPEEFKLSQGHENALKVKSLHLLVRRRWQDDAALAKDKAQRAKEQK